MRTAFSRTEQAEAVTPEPAERLIAHAGLDGPATEQTPAEVISPNWPWRVWVSLILTVALVGTLASPILLARPGHVELGVLLVPVVIAALTGRLVFQVLATPPDSRARRIGAALTGSGLAVGLVFAAGTALESPPTLPVAGGSLAAAVAIMLSARGLRVLERRLGAINRRVFFIGSEQQYFDLAREVSCRGDMSVVGRITLASARHAERMELVRSIQDARPTVLVMSSEAIRDDSLVATASDVHLKGLRVRGLSGFYEQEFGKVPLSDLSQAWFLFDVAEIHRPRIYGSVKRIVESGVAAVLMVLSAPLIPIVALLVKASGRGPVFYRQSRVGRDGREFTLTKFRTMDPAGYVGQRWCGEESERVTRIGRFLRRFRLDEIPQLWHVLRGDISLIGPRPEQPEIVKRLNGAIEFYGARHRVRPGITGWAQIHYGYGGSPDGTLEKLQYDFFYIKRQSLRLDLTILAATFRIILLGGGE